jgi:fatty-acyl-CoA synthase
MLQPGLMMERPLLISGIIEHAAAQFGSTQIVSRETHGPVFRYTFAESAARARRLAHALRHLGLGPGVRSDPSLGTITAIWKPITRFPAAAW